MSAVSANNTMVSSGKDASSSANVASPVTSGSPSELVHSNRSVYGVWEFFNIPVPSVSFASVAYMLIAVTILFALAIMHKHGAKPIWKPSSQHLSEKFRLYMAGSMVGDAARRMFNGWTRSRQDGMAISNRDEKNRPLDMSSSSSISLSPSEPVDYTAPRLYKKASNSRLSSHRRPNSRLKAQTLSPIDDNPSTVSSNDDQPNDQSTETDESKATVTINVSDPRSEQPILVPHQEIDCEIEGIPSNQLNQNFDDSQSAPPEDIHNKWASNNSITSASLFSSPMPASNYRRSSLTPSSPTSTSNESTTTSSISMFASSPFSTLTNHDRRNSNISSPTRSFTSFGKVYNDHDQEKGELTTAKVEAKEVNVTDEMRSLRTKILSNKDKMNEGMINTDQGRNVPQFSLFDKQLMYPSKS